MCLTTIASIITDVSLVLLLVIVQPIAQQMLATRKVIMKLTKRGERVSIIAFIAFMIGVMAIVGRLEAIGQCATFQANNDYQSALDAGCSFDPLPNGEYPYTWEANE